MYVYCVFIYNWKRIIPYSSISSWTYMKFYTFFYSIILFRKKKCCINKYCLNELNLNKYKLLTFFSRDQWNIWNRNFFKTIILRNEYITMQYKNNLKIALKFDFMIIFFNRFPLIEKYIELSFKANANSMIFIFCRIQWHNI